MKTLLLSTTPALFLATACIPHSAAVGQTAAPVAAGGAEVGMSIGVAQTRLTVTSDPDVPDTEDTTSQTHLPSVESNFLYGLTDKLGLNLHASSAGLQPGLKIGVVSGGDIDVAVMPAFAVGVFKATDEDSDSTDSFDTLTFLAGGKVLVSSKSGAYGALGYDYQRTSMDDPDSGTDGSVLTLHHLTGALGYSIDLGRGFSIRPEMAVLYGVAGTAADEPSDPGIPVDEDDVDSLTLFPNLTLSVSTN